MPPAAACRWRSACTPTCAPRRWRASASDELRREFLAPAIAGDMVGCLGVSEPGGGSDVAAVKTTARKDGGDYVINGSKMWITNGLQADWCCLLANTSEGAPHKNKSLIIVPMDARASRGRRSTRSACTAPTRRSSSSTTCACRTRNLIGQEGMGFTFQMLQFQEERLWGAASSLRSLDRLIDQTIEYTRQRKAFGKSILDNQVVHFRLAELRTEVEALRALTYRAVELYVGGKDVTKLASMAKLKCGRLSREVADSLPAVLGRHGLHRGQPGVARLPRLPPGLDRRRRRRGHARHHLQARGHAAERRALTHGRANRPWLAARATARVLHVTLNRPEVRNAMSLAMVRELRRGAGRGRSRRRDARRRAARRGRPLLRRRATSRTWRGAPRAPGRRPGCRSSKVNAAFGELCVAYARTRRWPSWRCSKAR